MSPFGRFNLLFNILRYKFFLQIFQELYSCVLFSRHEELTLIFGIRHSRIANA